MRLEELLAKHGIRFIDADEVHRQEMERDPYYAAIYNATCNLKDLDEFDAALDAFPDREEWERQQQISHSSQDIE